MCNLHTTDILNRHFPFLEMLQQHSVGLAIKKSPSDIPKTLTSCTLKPQRPNRHSNVTHACSRAATETLSLPTFASVAPRRPSSPFLASAVAANFGEPGLSSATRCKVARSTRIRILYAGRPYDTLYFSRLFFYFKERNVCDYI